MRVKMEEKEQSAQRVSPQPPQKVSTSREGGDHDKHEKHRHSEDKKKQQKEAKASSSKQREMTKHGELVTLPGEKSKMAAKQKSSATKSKSAASAAITKDDLQKAIQASLKDIYGSSGLPMAGPTSAGWGVMPPPQPMSFSPHMWARSSMASMTEDEGDVQFFDEYDSHDDMDGLLLEGDPGVMLDDEEVGAAAEDASVFAAEPNMVADDVAEMESEGDAWLDAHRARYEDEDGAPVRDSLAVLVNQIWDKGKDRDKIKECLQNYPRPSNIQAQKVDLNEEVIGAIPKVARSRDMRLRAIQGIVARTTVPVMMVMQKMLCSAKFTRKSVVDCGVDAIAMLASCNAALNALRRDFLRPNLNRKYQQLCDKAPPTTSQWLLGDDLQDKVKSTQQTEKLGRARGVMRASVVSRRSRAFQPYGFGYGSNQQGGFGRGRGRGGRGSFLGEYRSGTAIRQLRLNDKQSYDLRRLSINDNMDMETKPERGMVDNDKHNVRHEKSSWAQCNRDSMVLSVCACRPEEGRSGERPRQGAGQVRADPVDEGNPDEGVVPEERQEEVGKCEDLPCIDIGKYKVFKAGRLTECYQVWRRLTSDHKLLSAIRGYRIEFLEMPEQVRPEKEIRFTEVEREFVRTEIGKLLEKEVLEVVEHEEGEYISNVFLREKKEPGKYRMILNLKKLNKTIEHQHFKMDHLNTVLALVQQGCWFLSLDFSDAYYTLAVREQDRKYLRFMFEGNLYQYTCVPNGIRTGSRLFTKLLKVPLAYLREFYGITISGYLDDTILLNLNKYEVMMAGKRAAELFQELGYMISVEKSVIEPTQEIEYLGFIINSREMKVSMTEKKVAKILELVQQMLDLNACRIRFTASVLGKMTATGPANPWASLFTKRLEMAKTEALRAAKFDYDQVMEVGQECREDLHWWNENLRSLVKPIIRSSPELTICTDASLKGWGCWNEMTGESFGGRWSEVEVKERINWLELKAVWLSIQAICQQKYDMHLRVRSDNTTAVCCIKKQGSDQVRNLNELTRKIWLFAIEWGI